MIQPKVLFIDRDGTIIIEPQPSQQIDSLEKLEFLPKVITSLHQIAKLPYQLVMVTNQDGLGTDSFPEDTFWPAHNKMMTTLMNEGIVFKEVLIDKSFPKENLPTRKPGTGLVTHYMQGGYDLENSFVIGDRLTDIQLAKNMGTKAIFIGAIETVPSHLLPYCTLATTDWSAIHAFLRGPARQASVVRKTHETDISVDVNLDGSGKADIKTGLGFFDHMLHQIARHGNIDLAIKVIGDLHVDEHHTIEDTALALGEAVLKALGNKIGIERYGFCLPMDDCLAQVSIDFGGRNWLVWDTSFQREKIGDMPTEMFFHFFKSFSDSARCNLNIRAEGHNEHHKIEAIFKALAKAIRQAVRRDPENQSLPSTKGTL